MSPGSSAGRGLLTSLFPRLFILLLLSGLFLSACGKGRQQDETFAQSNGLLVLDEGVVAHAVINGLSYDFLLLRADNQSVMIRVNAQDFSLRTGEEFSFGDFIIKLEKTWPGRASIKIDNPQ